MHKPITFKEVSFHLNAANSESSIKKWLKELVDEGIIELKGSYKNSKYVISKYKEQK